MIKLESRFNALDFKSFDLKFSNMLKEFSPVKNSISISSYFGQGMGLASCRNKLFEGKQIPNLEDFPGVYVFLKNKIPFYVGISQHVIQRIMQHLKGKNHFSSSLCYKLGADHFAKINGTPHGGGRQGLPFNEYGELAKKELMLCDVAFYKVECSIELYLFEVYLALKLGTLNYNSFKTH